MSGFRGPPHTYARDLLTEDVADQTGCSCSRSAAGGLLALEALTCAVFFARDAMAAKEPLDRAVAEAAAPLGQRRAQFLDGDVRGCLDEVFVQRSSNPA